MLTRSARYGLLLAGIAQLLKTNIPTMILTNKENIDFKVTLL